MEKKTLLSHINLEPITALNYLFIKNLFQK